MTQTFADTNKSTPLNPRVVVVGGGYAGLSCLIELRRQQPEAELHLVDSSEFFIERTRLHETLIRGQDHFRIPFSKLAERHGFRFWQARVPLNLFANTVLSELDQRCRLPMTKYSGQKEELEFDALVLATGARGRATPELIENTLDLADLYKTEGRDLLSHFLQATSLPSRHILIVGAGATGVQFATSLKQALNKRGTSAWVGLMDMAARPLPLESEVIGQYVLNYLQRHDITFIGQTQLQSRHGNGAKALNLTTNETQEIECDWLWWFAGNTEAGRLHGDATGRIHVDGESSKRLYACGDCMSYVHGTTPPPTAQAAFVQGRHTASNILRRTRGETLHPLKFSSKGYLVGLGSDHAAGWLLSPHHIILGRRAAVIKKAVEWRDRAWIEGWLPSGLFPHVA